MPTPKQRRRLRRAALVEKLTNPILSAREVSLFLGLHAYTVRRRAATGHLRGEKLPNGYWRFGLREVLAFMEAMQSSS